MVLRLDFSLSVDRIRPAIDTYIETCENLMDNEDLKIFLRFVLHTGNFLNCVSTIRFSRVVAVIAVLNPCPAEPGYTLPLQTV